MQMVRFLGTVVLGLVLTVTTSVDAADGSGPAVRVRKAIASNNRVKAALAQIKSRDAATLQEQIEIAQIPSPSFKESVRAADYVRRLQTLGLSDAAIDAEGNVIAHRKGTGKGPTLVLSAHLDTVFPEGTDVSALDHILGGEQTISPDKGLFLEQTWRLHQDIC